MCVKQQRLPIFRARQRVPNQRCPAPRFRPELGIAHGCAADPDHLQREFSQASQTVRRPGLRQRSHCACAAIGQNLTPAPERDRTLRLMQDPERLGGHQGRGSGGSPPPKIAKSAGVRPKKARNGAHGTRPQRQRSGSGTRRGGRLPISSQNGSSARAMRSANRAIMAASQPDPEPISRTRCPGRRSSRSNSQIT
jgi:hypothetical protein